MQTQSARQGYESSGGANGPQCVLRKVQRSFARQAVLRSLSLELNPGELTLLLGANGAGKSTLLRIAVGLARADSGSVSFSGYKSGEIPLERLGYCGHDLMLYEHLTVRENLELWSKLRSLSADLDLHIEQWKLSDHRHKSIKELSQGLRYRAALARTFLSNPQYLFLDEPSAALDDATLALVSDEVRRVVSGKQPGFALVATHDLRRLREFANRIVVLDNGVIEADSKDSLEKGGSDQASALSEVVEFYRTVNR